MLKKTTLLSIATAAAVITTSVGTFAAYDTVTAEATASNVSFRKPVTITAGEMGLNMTGGGSGSLSVAPTASGEVTFKVTDADGLASNLKLDITVEDTSSSQKLTTDDFTFNISDSSAEKNSGCSGNGTTWNDTDLTGENKYTVTATLKDSAAAKLADSSHNGQINIKVTGTLS